MAVSSLTAAKAVTRWQLDGALYVRTCECREWYPAGARFGRLVYTCERHRVVLSVS